MTLLLAAVAALALVELAVTAVLRPQVGVFALLAALETQLLAAGAAAGVLLVLRTLTDTSRRGTVLKVLGIAVVVAGVVRLGGEWWSPGPEAPVAGEGDAGRPTGPPTLTVATWNLQQGSTPPADIVAALLDPPGEGRPTLVALQDLTPAVARAIEADDALDRAYPYRILVPGTRDDGIGLLSTLPLVKGADERMPIRVSAGLLLEDGSRVDVIATHPSPPRILTADLGPLRGIPVGLDTRTRDRALRLLRDQAGRVADPARVILVGDLATTPFEPGFGDVSRGLHDAHADAGSGTGFTWRPDALVGLDAGFLRIDHVLTGDALVPVASEEDCSLPGDHCRLTVTLEIAGD